MTKHASNTERYYREYYVYDGNTAIERIRKYSENRVIRDWLMFNSGDEAMEFFNNDIVT